MKKIFAALMAASFLFGLSTEDVDAKARRKGHNYMWHKGQTYKKHKSYKKVSGRKHKAKRKHRKSRRAALPPIVVAHIHIASQHMTLDVNGFRQGDFVISSGRTGFNTPQGSFKAFRMARTYFSRKYDNSPMPYSVFFSGGNAIHGTNHLRQLGRPASHGCVRLHPQHAAAFFDLVQHYGMNRTRVVVSN